MADMMDSLHRSSENDSQKRHFQRSKTPQGYTILLRYVFLWEIIVWYYLRNGYVVMTFFIWQFLLRLECVRGSNLYGRILWYDVVSNEDLLLTRVGWIPLTCDTRPSIELRVMETHLRILICASMIAHEGEDLYFNILLVFCHFLINI